MLSTLFRIHYVAIIAVIGSLLGSVLMMLIGGYHVILAFVTGLGSDKAYSPLEIHLERSRSFSKHLTISCWGSSCSTSRTACTSWLPALRKAAIRSR